MALRTKTNQPEGSENAMAALKPKLVGPKIVRRPVLGEIGNHVSTNIPSNTVNRRTNPLKNTLVHNAGGLKHSLHNVQIMTYKFPSLSEERQIMENSDIISKLTLGPPKAKSIPQNVEDADKNDKDNLFLVSEYVNDVYDYLRRLEDKFPIKEDYLTGREVSGKIRAVLIDWLVEVQGQFRLLQETLHSAVAIVDRYLQDVNVTKEKLQLVGVSAIFIASKYEEIYPPELGELVYVTDSAYSKDEILEMERNILEKLQFDLGRPISLTFLRRYSKVAKAQAIHHAYGKYFLDLALLDNSFCHIKPSLIAAAACFIAHCVVISNKGSFREFDSHVWSPTLKHYSKYHFADFKHLIPLIINLIKKAPSEKLQAVRVKYSTSKLCKISLQPAIAPDSAILNELLLYCEEQD